jgi:hypothetical protein
MQFLIALSLALFCFCWPGSIQAAQIPVSRIDLLSDDKAASDKPAVSKLPGGLDPKDVDVALIKPQEILTTQVCEQLAAAAQQHGLPVDFLARLIWQESRFDPRAVSRAGAQGLAQFMPRTAAEYGLRNPFDPLAALPASARFLRALHDQFGNLGLAAAAYNAGAGRIQNWLARRSKLPDETRNYVKIITGQPPEKWTDEDQTVDLALALPARAPCEGVGGLSRQKESASIAVNLTDGIAKLIQTAEAEAAKAAAAAKELVRKVAQAAKAGKARAMLLAKGKKSADEKNDRVANHRSSKKSAGRGRLRLADSWK